MRPSLFPFALLGPGLTTALSLPTRQYTSTPLSPPSDCFTLDPLTPNASLLPTPCPTNPWSSFNVLPPASLDPWYAPPANWDLAAPGTPLKLRTHAYPTINIRNCSDTYQLLYRSSDTHGRPSWAVTTVFVPTSHALSCDTKTGTGCAHALVSYQVPSDSVSPDAAPSYLLQAREPYGEMRDLLRRGWFVAVPDYEGPQAAYCAGKQAGYATLDGARAVLATGARFGLRVDEARVGLWGYSGGAFATGFAVELVGGYAPELVGRVRGAAVGGPSPNLTTVAGLMNGSRKDTAGLVIASVWGVTMQHPKARGWLEGRLKTEGEYNATGFKVIESLSGAEALWAYSGQDVYDYFENGAEDVWHPIIQEVIDADAVMGVHGIPPRDVPVFVYKAVEDEMSLVEETDDMVKRYCDGGATVLYHRNTEGGHNDELWSGRLRTMDFLSHVLETEPGKLQMVSGVKVAVPRSGCVTQNVSVPLDVKDLLPDWWLTGIP
ncbi:lipase 2 [Podospora conica]|nr:lipase 2 [Schizothecium conicum]